MAAASSSVSVTLLIPGDPPASDMMMASCPPGPISNMSMSPGLPWVMLFSFTVTFVIEPGIPETTIFEGYGAAGAGLEEPPGVIVVPGC